MNGVGLGAKYNSFTVELALALRKQNTGRRWTNGPDEGGLMGLFASLLHCFIASLWVAITRNREVETPGDTPGADWRIFMQEIAQTTPIPGAGGAGGKPSRQGMCASVDCP